MCYHRISSSKVGLIIGGDDDLRNAFAKTLMVHRSTSHIGMERLSVVIETLATVLNRVRVGRESRHLSRDAFLLCISIGHSDSRWLP